MNGRAPPRRPQVRMREEAADCAAVVLFFLLMVAVPAGSYLFLHRNLVSLYEQLADTLQQQATEVSKLQAEVAQFADIRDTLSFSADLLRDITSQHIYSSYVSEHPNGDGSRKYEQRGRSASGAADGGGTLGEISAAAGAMASSLWAAEDWAAKKLALPWTHSDPSSSNSGSQQQLRGSQHGGMSGGARHGSSTSGGGVSREEEMTHSSHGSSGGAAALQGWPPGKCIPGKIQWEGDTPAVWHHYFEPLKATIEPGYFVDVGAGDGVFTSNTFFLERERCWKGIAIEPTNNEYPKLERQRTGTTTVHGAVCEQDGWKPFLDVTLDGLWTGWSGFKDTFDDHHAHQVDANVRLNKGWEAKEYKVHCFRLQSLLDMERRTHVNYLTVSVEGHEQKVLKSVKWEAVTVDVIEVAIHSRFDRDQMAVFLEGKGYEEDTMWPHAESLVFLQPNFKQKLAAVKRGIAY